MFNVPAQVSRVSVTNARESSRLCSASMPANRLPDTRLLGFRWRFDWVNAINHTNEARYGDWLHFSFIYSQFRFNTRITLARKHFLAHTNIWRNWCASESNYNTNLRLFIFVIYFIVIACDCVAQETSVSVLLDEIQALSFCFSVKYLDKATWLVVQYNNN